MEKKILRLSQILCSLADLLKQMKKYDESEELLYKGPPNLIHGIWPRHPQVGDIYN